MSGSKIVSSFSEEVTQALCRALDTKGRELDSREEDLNQKEEKLRIRENYLNKIFSNHYEKHQQVVVQVGSCSFETTFDVLLSQPDSYFHMFQWTPDDKELVLPPPAKVLISRDPTSFRFVLEYLTYGELFSQIKDEGVLNMLKYDAKFYGLPELAEKVQKRLDIMLSKKNRKQLEKEAKKMNKQNIIEQINMFKEAKQKYDTLFAECSLNTDEIRKTQADHTLKLKEVQQRIAKSAEDLNNLSLKHERYVAQPPLYLKTATNDVLTTQQFINWKLFTTRVDTHLLYDGRSTFNVLKKCLLQLSMRHTLKCSTANIGFISKNLANENFANVNLLVNDNAVACCYLDLGYIDKTQQIHDTRAFKINDRIQFQYISNCPTIVDSLGTCLTIVVLHTY